MRRYGAPAWYSQSTYSLNIIPEEYVPPVDYDIDFHDAIHDETTAGGGQIGGESLDRRGWSGASTGNRTTLTASVHNNLMNGRMSSSSHNLSTRLSGSSQNLHQPTNAYGVSMNFVKNKSYSVWV
uniref:Anaphase-promoting complex subunit 13 n=1 Tax=Caenorhabditis tropicalis TaxID=1561998 RepID=A0A1I7TZV5_9PELO